jgi:alkylation response protein AidB-like acyl-CoA dehydrogenase
VHGRVAVPLAGPTGAVSLAVVDAANLTVARLDTFDPSIHWNSVRGPLNGPLVDAQAEWDRAVAAAHRALATELIAVSEEILRIAVDHVSVRVQFGTPIGALQSPRHALADASAHLAGARALLGESWCFGAELSAQSAKIAAGRANRAVTDAALQVCGAIGLTAEHDLHRYVNRGFQLDALCGSHQQLEALLAEHLFETYSPGQALPAIIALS